MVQSTKTRPWPTSVCPKDEATAKQSLKDLNKKAIYGLKSWYPSGVFSHLFPKHSPLCWFWKHVPWTKILETHPHQPLNTSWTCLRNCCRTSCVPKVGQVKASRAEMAKKWNCWTNSLPSGKLTACYRKSPFWIGKSTINGMFSIANSWMSVFFLQ